MSYEVWVGIALVLNTLFGAYAIWQRHQTIIRLRGDVQPPSVPHHGIDVPALNDFFKGLEKIDEARQSDRQDEGPSKGWDYPRY